MTTFQKVESIATISAIFLSMVTGWCLALVAHPREPAAIIPWCPSRNQCWQAATSFARIAVEQAVATCTYSEAERAWHRHVEAENVAMQDDEDTVCQFRVDELYDAWVSAELERGFEPWYAEDQLLCGCISGAIANPHLGDDDECREAFLHVCRQP